MTVIVGIDPTEDNSGVVAEGARHAEAFGEPLHLVHVLSQSRFRKLEQTSVEESGKTIPINEIRSHAEEIAEDAASDVEREFTPVGLVGDAAEGLLKYIEDVDASYVVLGGRRRSAVGKVLFGSVTQSVLLNADGPVVTVMSEPED